MLHPAGTICHACPWLHWKKIFLVSCKQYCEQQFYKISDKSFGGSVNDVDIIWRPNHPADRSTGMRATEVLIVSTLSGVEGYCEAFGSCYHPSPEKGCLYSGNWNMNIAMPPWLTPLLMSQSELLAVGEVSSEGSHLQRWWVDTNNEFTFAC